jgi:hypothetical protein
MQSSFNIVERDKSLHNSSQDYVTLENYQASFLDMPKTSNLRYAIVPGSLKKINNGVWLNFAQEQQRLNDLTDQNDFANVLSFRYKSASF